MEEWGYVLRVGDVYSSPASVASEEVSSSVRGLKR